MVELATSTAHDITDPFDRARALTSLVKALVSVAQPRSTRMDLVIRVLAEVTATSDWVMGVALIASCTPEELRHAVDDAFGTWR